MEVELMLSGLGTRHRLYGDDSVNRGSAVDGGGETEVGFDKARACLRGLLSHFLHQTNRGVNPPSR